MTGYDPSATEDADKYCVHQICAGRHYYAQ